MQQSVKTTDTKLQLLRHESISKILKEDHHYYFVTIRSMFCHGTRGKSINQTPHLMAQYDPKSHLLLSGLKISLRTHDG